MLSLEDRADPVAMLGSLINAGAANRLTVVVDPGSDSGGTTSPAPAPQTPLTTPNSKPSSNACAAWATSRALIPRLVTDRRNYYRTVITVRQ